MPSRVKWRSPRTNTCVRSRRISERWALIAAAERPDAVRAVISRGGRPDLAGTALPLVRAPTLLIVGGHDVQVADLNRRAVAQMRAEVRLDIVPGATHLFEEPGALEAVCDLAIDWCRRHLDR